MTSVLHLDPVRRPAGAIDALPALRNQALKAEFTRLPKQVRAYLALFKVRNELASVLPLEQLELIRQKLQQLPEPRERPRLTKRDWIGALGLCLLSFASTFPVVIPFIFLSDAKLALRVTYGVAIAMLFCCGYAFGYRSGLRRPGRHSICGGRVGFRHTNSSAPAEPGRVVHSCCRLFVVR